MVGSTNLLAAAITIGKIEADLREGKPIDSADALNLAGNVVAIAAALGMKFSPVGRSAKYIFIAARAIGVLQIIKFTADRAHAGDIDPSVNDRFTAAQSAVMPKFDPLVLDLDGDGIETVGIDTGNPIYFDQDGASQSGELFTLESLGIVSLGVAATAHAQTLANGNRIAKLGGYLKADGTLGQSADVDLAEDTFHSRFTAGIPITEAVQGLSMPLSSQRFAETIRARRGMRHNSGKRGRLHGVQSAQRSPLPGQHEFGF